MPFTPRPSSLVQCGAHYCQGWAVDDPGPEAFFNRKLEE